MSPNGRAIPEEDRLRQGVALLVEDEEVLRSQLASAMNEAGLQVVSVKNSRQAQEILLDENFTHIVLDLRLPDGNGVDLIKTCRSTQPNARIVMISGYGSLAAVVIALRAGAFDFLAKPFGVDRLMQSLFLRQPPPARLPETPMHPNRVRWERINRVYEQSGRNLSRTAKLLGIHRQTVARNLSMPPKFA